VGKGVLCVPGRPGGAAENPPVRDRRYSEVKRKKPQIPLCSFAHIKIDVCATRAHGYSHSTPSGSEIKKTMGRALSVGLRPRLFTFDPFGVGEKAIHMAAGTPKASNMNSRG